MKAGADSRPSYLLGPYLIDALGAEVTEDGTPVPLTPTEFDVLYQIVQRDGKIIGRPEFLPWKQPVPQFPDRHPVDGVVAQIRRKFGRKIIETAHGKGYRLARGLTVELVSTPSSSAIEKVLAIARAQVNKHSTAGFRAAVTNCEELLAQGKAAEACTILAHAYVNLGHAGFCRELPTITIPKAREALKIAIERNPEFASAYEWRGLTYLIFEYDWTSAERDLASALRYNPDCDVGHSFTAHMLASREKFEPALIHAHRAAELDYENGIHVMTESWIKMFAGRADAVIEAEKVARRFRDNAPVQIMYGHCCRASGDLHAALKMYEQALEIDFLPNAVSGKGFVYGQLGQRENALQCLEELEDKRASGVLKYVSGLDKALVYAAVGERTKSLDALESAFTEPCDWLIHLAIEPRWKDLHEESRFWCLAKRVGIIPSTR